MIIAMTHDMSGGRWDDRQWPARGVPFEVTDEEGEGSVRSGSAVDLTGKVKRDDLLAHLRLPGTPHVTPPAPVSMPAETAAGPVAPDRETVFRDDLEEAVGDLPGGPGVPLEPPKPADPKQDWMDYAVTQGMTEDEAGNMTKADLMSRFGGRLLCCGS